MFLQTLSHIDSATLLGLTALTGSFLFSLTRLTRLTIRLRKKV